MLIARPLRSLASRAPLRFSLLRLSAAVKPYERPPSHGLQYYSAVPGEDVVGQPYRHMAADQQVGGAAGQARAGRWAACRAGQECRARNSLTAGQDTAGQLRAGRGRARVPRGAAGRRTHHAASPCSFAFFVLFPPSLLRTTGAWCGTILGQYPAALVTSCVHLRLHTSLPSFAGPFCRCLAPHNTWMTSSCRQGRCTPRW